MASHCSIGVDLGAKLTRNQNGLPKVEKKRCQRLILLDRILWKTLEAICCKMSAFTNTSYSLQEFICHRPLTDTLHNNPEVLIVNICFYILNSITATFGNVLVLVAIWQTPSLHSPSNSLLFGLALCDLCAVCVAQPVFVTVQILIYNNDGLQSCALNKAAFLLNIFFSKVALLTMTSISIDRYLAIYLHLRYREIVTDRKINIIIPAIWTAVGATATLMMSFLTMKVLQWTLIVAEAICLTIALYVWIKIYQNIRRHRAQIQHQAQIQQFNMVKFKKSASNSMLLMFFYLLCYLPLFISLVRLTLNLNKNSFLGYFISYTFVVLNSSLNPLIYCEANINEDKLSSARSVSSFLKKTLKFYFMFLLF